MIGRFAQRRKGRTEIASLHHYAKRLPLGIMTGFANNHERITTTSMQSCTGLTIKAPCRGSSVLSGCRIFGLPVCRHFCTQTKVQAKPPSPKVSSEPTRIRLSGRGTDERDKALVQETTTYADSLKHDNGGHGFLKEKNKLSMTSELGFCGKVFIPPKHTALARATNIFEENTDQHHFVFFVDGSLITKIDAESGSVVTCSGAAVVYKPRGGDQPWVEQYFAPPKCERGSDRIEVIAILDGLKFAAVETDQFRRCDPGDSDDMPAKLKVTIFSDCTSALQLLHKLQSKTIAKSPLLDDPVIRELIAVSQYLRRNGIELELRWVPGHSLNEGNTLANGAAQYAARNPEIGAILEKRLRVRVEPSSSIKDSP